MIYHYVIAGSYEEYRHHIKEKQSTPGIKFVYVTDESTLKGVVNPHGVFIGSWQEHPKIDKILTNLLIYSREYNPSLDKVLKLRNMK